MDKLQDVEEENRLAAHAQRVLKSGALGKSRQIIRLFEFLLERSLMATPTKEVEIALVVFGRPTNVDLAADATVRVHIHRLRKNSRLRPSMSVASVLSCRVANTVWWSLLPMSKTTTPTLRADVCLIGGILPARRFSLRSTQCAGSG
ncbi:hypothetical protein RHM66_22720 [Pseudomonas sp. RTB3]|nr:hypothetical protein RHM66_22720 [Pseudomonas sp. RTB3]